MSSLRASALQAHGDHRTGERSIGALAGVLLAPDKPGVEFGRVGEQPLVSGSLGCAGGVESVTIRRICLRMSSGSAMSEMALP